MNRSIQSSKGHVTAASKSVVTKGNSAAGAANGPEEREVVLSTRDVSLALLFRRHSSTMRIVDFRAGPSERKRQAVLEVAKREGVEKVFTLVERDEVATWIRLGFQKEATIPGFYKRSDAYLVGSPTESALRAGPARVGGEPDVFEDEDDGSEEESDLSSRTNDADRTLYQSKKLLRDLKSTSPVKLSEVSKEEAELAHTRAKGKRTLTSFEQFGRDVVRRYFLARSKGFELALSVESQTCFSNAFLEVAWAPGTPAETQLFSTSLRLLNDLLQKEGTVSCFALCPVDDISFAAVFLANGFRKTGVLQAHVQIGKERKDVILFSRKLANPLAD